MASEIFTKKMDRLFRSLDVTNDGYLDSQDLNIVIGAMATKAPLEGVADEFRSASDTYWAALGMDINGDSRLDGSGFAAAMEREMCAAGRFDELLAPVGSYWFVLYDLDGDGAISFDEWEKGLVAHRDSMTDLKSGFDALDSDGDGVISKEEWVTALKEYCSSQDPDARGNFLLGPFE